MVEETIQFKSIGTIHTSFHNPVGMPIQPAAAAGIKGYIEVIPSLEEGLKDLEGFSHIALLYFFHRSGPFNLLVTPFLDTVKRGVFSTRAPRRPNPIGLSVVRLVSVQGNRLDIENVDILDGTPLLDIKPYVPTFDPGEVDRIGWLEKSVGSTPEKRSDDRFTKAG